MRGVSSYEKQLRYTNNYSLFSATTSGVALMKVAGKKGLPIIIVVMGNGNPIITSTHIHVWCE